MDLPSPKSENLPGAIPERFLSALSQRFFAPRFLAVGLCLALTGLSSAARSEPALVLTDGWVRAMPPMQTMTAGYGVLSNEGGSTVRLTRFTSNIATEVTLHETIRSADQVSMQALKGVVLAPGEHLELQPGGNHLMLMGVSDMPAKGSMVELCFSYTAGDSAGADLDTGEECQTVMVMRSGAPEPAEEHRHHGAQ